MADTVIAPDLREQWEALLLDAADNGGEFTDEDAAWSVKMIERVSKAEAERDDYKKRAETFMKGLEAKEADCNALHDDLARAEQENVALRAELEDWKSAGRMEEEEFQDICASEQIRPSTCCQPKYCHLAPFHEIKLLREELAARGREGE